MRSQTCLKKILFLNFYAFSLTGGIEKFCRALLKALADLSTEGRITAEACSAYDDTVDTRYFPKQNYTTFKREKLRFAFNVLLNAYKYDTIILSHIHLSSIAWIIKTLFPSKKIILVAHGIEVWGKVSTMQKSLLRKADMILAVSHFTKQKLVAGHHIDDSKIRVFPNTIDPYFDYPSEFQKPQYLVERYHIQPNQPVVLTLTRLAHTEKNKGYDLVIKTLPELTQHFPNVTYLLAGKADEREQQRLETLIKETQTNKHVILTGFIKDTEIVDHFLLADVFIMPSSKEGFGIVFIEAMACGLRVIAGNKDGSVDALLQGELGLLIDPESETEILQALQECLGEKSNFDNELDKKELQQKVYEAFGFEMFKRNLREVLGVGAVASSPRPSPRGEGSLVV